MVERRKPFYCQRTSSLATRRLRLSVRRLRALRKDNQKMALLLLDSTMWIALAAAIAVGVIAVLVCLVVLLRAGRRRRNATSLLRQRLETSTAKFEGMVSDLARDLERAQEENRRTRQLSGLGGSIDLDTVLSRTLEAAAALDGVDAAMLVVPADDVGPVVATYGMTEEEAGRYPAVGAPSPEALAVEISFRYVAPEEEDSGRIHGGVALPLRTGGEEPVGTLTAFWRHADDGASEETLKALEQLAEAAGPAVENARRFREARRLADLDALTSLHNRRYFHDTLGREVSRAHRYDRKLALVVFDIDDFKAINERVGHLAGDAVLSQLAERVRSVVRNADIACRVGGDEFAVILPESALADAEQLYRRLQFAVATKPTGPAERLHLSAGIAELTPEDDAVSFFERADEALFRAKQTGKSQAVAAQGA
jgi:diguanylate cyclase (GGDEF)-like protein